MTEYNRETEEDEISLKQVINTVKEYIREIFKYWWIVVIFISPFLARNIYKHINTPEVMSANVKFIVESNGGGGPSIGGLLGSFGFGGGGDENPFKITEVGKSKRTIGNILFTEIEGDYIANRIIDKYNLNEMWAKGLPMLADFRFTHDSIPAFTRKENTAFKLIYSQTVGKYDPSNALVNITYDDEYSIYLIFSKTVDETLSYELAVRLYDELKYFFEEKVMEDKILTAELLREKRDSLSILINQKTLQAAQFDDTSRGLVSTSALYQKNKLMLEVQGLTTAYTETWKNYEMADYDIRSSKPTYLKVDQSFLPLSGEEPQLSFALITAILLGGMLSVAFICGRKLYRDIMV